MGLETVRAGDFFGIRGSRVRLTGDGGAASLEVELADVTEYPVGASGAFRTPFSVLFHGPLEPVIPQGIYRLEHEKLGTLEFFIVPVGPTGTADSAAADSAAADAVAAGPAMRYEAVFG